MQYTQRDLANALDGKPTDAAARATRRVVDALDTSKSAPQAQPLDMSKHLELFREAAEARVVHAGDVPDRLRHHAAVNAGVNAYAAAARRARPSLTDEDAVWEARNKRSELIEKHQFSSPYVDDVLATVAEALHAEARTIDTTTTTPARTTATENRATRRVERIRDIRGGTITPLA